MSEINDGSATAAHQATDAQRLRLVSLCAFASMASLRVCDAMLPALSAAFLATTGQAALSISGFALAYGLLQLLYGPLGDRYGKTRVIGYATLACTVGSLAAALSPTLEWLIASRVLGGMAAAGIIPLSMAWIGDSVAYDRRQEVLAKLLGATVFGMICGQWFGGLLADLLGWRSAFAALAVLFLVSGTLLMRLGRAHPQLVPAGGRQGGALPAMLYVFGRPWARVVLLVTCIEGALAFSALAFIPSHLHLVFDLTMPMAGAIATTYGLGGLLYSRSARVLMHRLGEIGLVRLGGGSLFLAFAAVAYAPSWPWALPACLLAGFGFYALHNTLQTHATQMAPAVRGTAVSLFACVLFLGQSLGIALAAWGMDRSSSATIFVVAAFGLLVLSIVFSTLLGQRQRRAQRLPHGDE